MTRRSLTYLNSPRVRLACQALLVLALICTTMAGEANVITDWDAKAVRFVAPAAHGQREMAILHVAMFDAVNAMEHRYRPFLVDLTPPKPISQDAAAAAAAATVLAGLHPEMAAEVNAALANYLAAIPDSEARSKGVKFGGMVATQVLRARATDGADAPEAYRPITKPGVYDPDLLDMARYEAICAGYPIAVSAATAGEAG